jgi:hypothetical protein
LPDLGVVLPAFVGSDGERDFLSVTNLAGVCIFAKPADELNAIEIHILFDLCFLPGFLDASVLLPKQGRIFVGGRP